MIGRHLKDCTARSQRRSFVPFGEGAGETDILKTTEQNPRCKFGVWLGARNNSQCFVETVEGVRGQEERTSQQVGQRSNQQCDRSAVDSC